MWLRFNDISSQVDRVAEDAEAEFRAAVDELNALSEQLLVVNKQLNRKTRWTNNLQDFSTSETHIRDMASLTKIGVTESPSGQVSVNFGGSGHATTICDATEVKQLQFFEPRKIGSIYILY